MSAPERGWEIHEPDDAVQITVERADNGAWWVVIDGRRVSDHRGHEAARIAARRHQGIDTERAR